MFVHFLAVCVLVGVYVSVSMCVCGVLPNYQCLRLYLVI